MGSIFLSHSHKDKEFVDEVNRQLNSSGVSTWYDDTSLVNGDRLHGEIVKGICSAKVFCLFYSKEAAKSGNVRFEIDHAIKNRVSDTSFQLCVFLLDDVEIPQELGIWTYKKLLYVENKISFVLEELRLRCPPSVLVSSFQMYSLALEALDAAYEITENHVFGSYFIDQKSNLLLILQMSSTEEIAYEATIHKKLGSRFVPKYTFTGQGRVQKFGIDQSEGRSILSISSWDGGNGMGEHFFSLIDLNTFEEFSYNEGRLYAYYNGPINPLVRLGEGLFISEQSFYELAQKYEFFEKEEVDRKFWFYANRLWLSKNNDKSNFGRVQFISFELGLEDGLDKKLEGVGCQWLMGERGPIVYKDIQTGKQYIAVATASRYNEFEDLQLIKDGISFSVDQKKFELKYEDDSWILFDVR
jgi:hypothetical protein